MKKSIALFLTLLLVTSLVFTACDQTDPEDEIIPYPVVVKNVTIEKAPRTVASLSPVLTQMLLDLGYQNKITGYSEEDQIPDEVILSNPPSSEATASEESSQSSSSDSQSKSESDLSSDESEDKPDITPMAIFREPSSEASSEPTQPETVGRIGTALYPDLEQIGWLKPEIIFTTEPFTKAQQDKLDAVNIKTIIIPTPTSIDQLKKDYLSIIRAMEGEKEASTTGQALVDSLQLELDYIASKVPSEKQTFLFLNELSVPLVAGGDTFESSVLGLIGKNLAETRTGYEVSEKDLKEMNPSAIFYSAPITKEDILELTLFEGTTAVEEDRIIEVSSDLLHQRNRGVISILRDAAKKLYPEVDFEKPLPSSEAGSSTDE